MGQVQRVHLSPLPRGPRIRKFAEKEKSHTSNKGNLVPGKIEYKFVSATRLEGEGTDADESVGLLHSNQSHAN